MGNHPVATNYRELITWQLCHQLRRLILKYTRNRAAREDLRYCSDIRAAARSACNNTSEGYGRKRDGDFLNHLIIARASLTECEDQLDEGLDRQFYTVDQHREMKRILIRAFKTNAGLRAYLAKSIEEKKRREQLERAKKQAERRMEKGTNTPVRSNGPRRTRRT